jgi:hypothetical protein
VTDDAGSLLQSARERLAAAGAARERTGELVRPRLLAGLRSPKIVPRAEVWRVGVLLIGEEDVFAEGNVVRAADPGRRGFTAEATRTRAELAAAAIRGGFGEGEPAHLDAVRLDLGALGRGESTGPLALVGGVPHVRWSPAAGYTPLAGYLEERIALLLHPPQGA